MSVNSRPGVDDERMSLCEVLDRVLNTGVVVVGEVIISVAGIDLVYLGLNLTLMSVETARRVTRHGLPDSAAVSPPVSAPAALEAA
jgi:hypothetical protein